MPRLLKRLTHGKALGVLSILDLGHVVELAKPIPQWPEFEVVCKLTLEKVVPRLLLPLQSEARYLKPCLIHGDCWDRKW